jgi:Tfp pilus assembly protein PilE
MNRQRGMTFISLVLMIAGIVFVAVIGLKLYPAYSEYFAVKKAFASLKTQMASGEMTNKDIVAAFDKQQAIDDFKSVSGKDLVIEQDPSGKQVVSVEYSVVEPLVGNVSALVDFSLSTDDSAKPAAAAE